MTREERARKLSEFRARIRSGEWRTDIQERRDLLSEVVPLLNFNEVYYSNAFPLADILGRPGFSSNMYETTEAQLDTILGQAIVELQHDLTPKEASANNSILLPLTEKEGVVWFLRNCAVSTHIKLWAMVGVICATAYALGRNDFFVQLVELVKKAVKP